jgi:hypothetical protein
MPLKPKLDREYRMNWAGASPHPIEDIDIFNRLPSWRQAELRELHEVVFANPHAQAFSRCDPATGKVYPGQVLISDILAASKRQQKALPRVPAGYKFTVPNGAPLGMFIYYRPPTEQEAYQILLAIEQHVSHEKLVEFCTYDQRLLSDKPLDGVFAFIWRLARYLSGADLFFPSTAFIDLIDGVSRLTHLRVDPYPVKTIAQFLESKAEELVDIVGGNRKAGAMRWAQVTGVY